MIFYVLSHKSSDFRTKLISNSITRLFTGLIPRIIDQLEKRLTKLIFMQGNSRDWICGDNDGFHR